MNKAWPNCDFCGIPAKRLSRPALDLGYDRLTGKERPLFACPKCTREKEESRLKEEAEDALSKDFSRLMTPV